MAVNATTVAASAHLTKRLYMEGQRVKNVANHMHPLYDMVDDQDDWEGDGNFGWTVEWGRNQAVGANFGVVQGNIDNNKGDRFNFTARRFLYGLAQLDGEVMRATKSDLGAIERVTTRAMDQTVLTMKDRLAMLLYGNGSGKIGQRLSAAANVLTLTNPDDAKNFQKGQYIQSSATLTGGAARTGQCQVVRVTYGLTTSTVEVDNVANITSFADADFLYNSSDYDAVPRGLESWLPTSDPLTSDSYLGVNRSSDNLRLAGHRLDGTGYGTLKEVSQDLAMLVGRIAKGDKAGMLNPIKWEQLSKDLGTKAVRDPSDKATFGYSFIVQSSSCGEIKWYPDVDCPTNRMYILNPKGIFLKHLGKVPHVCDEDGLILRAATNADAYQARWRFMGDVGFMYPGEHGVAQI